MIDLGTAGRAASAPIAFGPLGQILGVSYADRFLPHAILWRPEITAVTIDIEPRKPDNPVRPGRGTVRVAALSTEGFDVRAVDVKTVQFGPSGAQPRRSRRVDVDRDGDLDLLMYFPMRKTGIECGDTEATLTGLTTDGRHWNGSDHVVTRCR
jgi:hypothetical protein